MIAIVGAGITGLYLAKLLQDKDLDYRLYEAKDVPGGNIGTVKEGPYLFETGPNSIRMNANFHHLVEDLGLQSSVRYTDPRAKKRFVLKDGVYSAMPLGPISLLFGSFFRFKEVRRIMKERRIAPGKDPQETVDAFFRRRFGDAVADYLVSPFISGIFAGDSKALVLSEAFPALKEWEHEYGSVLKGFFKGRKKSEHKGIFSFEGGLGQLAVALGESLGERLELGQKLKGLEKSSGGWRLEFEGKSVEAAQVVLALPAYITAGFIEDMDPDAAEFLQKVNYPPLSVVQSAFPRTAIKHPLDGFGALHNHLEPTETLGTIFSSTTFPGRCPSDEVLLTSFVGGARHPEKAKQSDTELQAAVAADYQRFLGLDGQPVFSKVIRWEHAIPQYDQRILPVRKYENKWSARGLHFAGNWTYGISVPSCLEKAHLLCEQLRK